MTAPGRLRFSTVRALLWINFAEFVGKNRSGRCGQLALTSTSTLLVGTTICSCLVGIDDSAALTSNDLTPAGRYFVEDYYDSLINLTAEELEKKLNSIVVL